MMASAAAVPGVLGRGDFLSNQRDFMPPFQRFCGSDTASFERIVFKCRRTGLKRLRVCESRSDPCKQRSGVSMKSLVRR